MAADRSPKRARVESELGSVSDDEPVVTLAFQATDFAAPRSPFPCPLGTRVQFTLEKIQMTGTFIGQTHDLAVLVFIDAEWHSQLICPVTSLSLSVLTGAPLPFTVLDAALTKTKTQVKGEKEEDDKEEEKTAIHAGPLPGLPFVIAKPHKGSFKIKNW